MLNKKNVGRCVVVKKIINYLNEIKSLLESVFEKVGRQKVKCTVHFQTGKNLPRLLGMLL